MPFYAVTELTTEMQKTNPRYGMQLSEEFCQCDYLKLKRSNPIALQFQYNVNMNKNPCDTKSATEDILFRKMSKSVDKWTTEGGGTTAEVSTNDDSADGPVAATDGNAVRSNDNNNVAMCGGSRRKLTCAHTHKKRGNNNRSGNKRKQEWASMQNIPYPSCV